MGEIRLAITGERTWLPGTLNDGSAVRWIPVPLLDFRPLAPGPWEEGARTASDLWCIFASGRGVRFWWEHEWEAGLSARFHYAAIGSQTATRLEELGKRCEFVGDGRGSEVFLEPFLAQAKGADWPIVVAGARGGRTFLAESLARAGRTVFTKMVYESRPLGEVPKALWKEVCEADGVVFTSPSSVEAFFAQGAWQGRAFALGEFTASALRRRGIEPHILPVPDLTTVGDFFKGEP